VYGAGHSERVLGRALSGRRDEVVIATKFGNTFDESTREITGEDASPEYVRSACEASLRRLGTDHIDLYQLHLSGYDPVEAVQVREALEELVTAGLIRAYAWSTDDPDRARVFAAGEHCAAVQHELNVLSDAPALIELCETHGLASINRSPLAMGLLTGKFDAGSRLPPNDIRGQAPAWLKWFRDGRPAPEWLERLTAVRGILQGGGRSLAAGALGWILGRSLRTVPIPGFRTVAQVEDNLSALEHAPLSADELRQVEELLR
jgi:aryl-alcohol dehydrogenase-like predicted oxidoreductase